MSADELASLLDHCPLAIARLDRQGRHVYANRAAVEMLGRPREQILGRRFADFGFPAETAELWARRLDEVVRENRPAEFRDSLPSGKEDFVLRYVPETAEGGAVEHVLVYAHVEPHRVLEAPKKDLSREALAIKLAKVGIWDWELATDRTSWNDEMLRIYGVRREDFTGKGADYLAFTREDYRVAQRSNIGRAFEAGVTEAELLERGASFSPKELCIVGADGQERFTYGDAIAIVDELRRPVRMLGVTMDVTEQKRAENARAELEERFTKAFRYNPAAMSIATLEGFIVEANEQFGALFGFAVDDLPGRDVVGLGVELAADERARIRGELMSTGSVRDVVMSIRVRSGERRELSLSSELITIAGERRVLSFVSDRTEANRLQEQLRRSQRLEAIGRLAGGVAHDFNNLLSVINACAEMGLRTATVDDARREDFTAILAAGQRGAELTRQLLAFGRKQVVDARPLDLGELVRAFEPLLRRAAGSAVSLSFVVPRAPAIVDADRGQLEQVLMNLVLNARDASDDGGRIDVSVGRDGGGVTLEVRDDGHGIPDDVRDHVFDPFFTTKRGKGTGLGLATVHGIVAQSGGSIVLESEVGQGTRFLVRFPASVAAPAVASRRPITTAPPRPAVVLYVEDDPDVRAVTRRMLTSAGWTVREAPSAEAALALFTEAPDVDLLLTDLVLPGMNGRELAERLRARTPALPVIFVSGHSADVLEGAALPQGAELLQKPCAADTLLARLAARLPGADER